MKKETLIKILLLVLLLIVGFTHLWHQGYFREKEVIVEEAVEEPRDTNAVIWYVDSNVTVIPNTFSSIKGHAIYIDNGPNQAVRVDSIAVPVNRDTVYWFHPRRGGEYLYPTKTEDVETLRTTDEIMKTAEELKQKFIKTYCFYEDHLPGFKIKLDELSDEVSRERAVEFGQWLDSGYGSPYDPNKGDDINYENWFNEWLEQKHKS